jgi:hypothetical protein
LNATALPFRITIYRTVLDLVGVVVSGFVSEEGFALQRSPVEMEAPVVCTGTFTLLGNSDGSSGIDLDPDSSDLIRPGAPVYYQYQNYAGVWVEVPWGARQVIAFATADRPDSIEPGEQTKPWSVEIQTQQTLKQQQWIESAFDAEYGKAQPGKFTTAEQIGAYRTLNDLADSICTAKKLPFSPQPGDPAPSMEYNGYVGIDPRTADSALAYLNKILYCNPDTSGKAYFLWQDNQNRVRVGVADLKTTSTNLLFNYRWELYGEDLITFKPIKQQRQQMPGKLRVHGIAQFDVFKTNPIESTERSGNDGTNEPAQIQTAYSYDYNDWGRGTRFTKTQTTVPANLIALPKTPSSSTPSITNATTGDTILERVETTKTYTIFFGRRLEKVVTERYAPKALADGKTETTVILLTRETKTYTYNSDGTVDKVDTQTVAVPNLVQGSAIDKTALKRASSSIDKTRNTGGSAYVTTRFRAVNQERQADNMIYHPGSSSNTPESRPQNAETQEVPWETKQVPLFQDRELLYNGVTLSDRIKTIDVGPVVFGGQRMPQLADNLAIRLSGGYSQYEVKFPLSDATAAAWTKPGLGLKIYDYLTNKTKVFGSFGGETIVFGADSVECLVNAEYLGTVENGNQITPAEVQRLTLSGADRQTLSGATRIP